MWSLSVFDMSYILKNSDNEIKESFNERTHSNLTPNDLIIKQINESLVDKLRLYVTLLYSKKRFFSWRLIE